ncbi:MAG: hypothetical protein Q9174_000387 [Haloplaca sp. 1 TL-2023]
MGDTWRTGQPIPQYQKTSEYPLNEVSWQMLRQDFLAFERLWIQQQDQSAPTLPASHDDIDLDQKPEKMEGQDQYIHQALAQEHAETEALVSMFEDSRNDGNMDSGELLEDCSEGEGYDTIFTEMLSQSSQRNHRDQRSARDPAKDHREAQSNDAMDMTGG